MLERLFSGGDPTQRALEECYRTKLDSVCETISREIHAQLPRFNEHGIDFALQSMFQSIRRQKVFHICVVSPCARSRGVIASAIVTQLTNSKFGLPFQRSVFDENLSSAKSIRSFVYECWRQQIDESNRWTFRDQRLMPYLVLHLTDARHGRQRRLMTQLSQFCRAYRKLSESGGRIILVTEGNFAPRLVQRLATKYNENVEDHVQNANGQNWDFTDSSRRLERELVGLYPNAVLAVPEAAAQEL